MKKMKKLKIQEMKKMMMDVDEFYSTEERNRIARLNTQEMDDSSETWELSRAKQL